jgi:hypothetical protein
MMTSPPDFQFAGVATLRIAVSWIESSTRTISSKLRPASVRKTRALYQNRRFHQQ